MRNSWYVFVAIWLFVIFFPEIIAYILGAIFLFIGLNILFFQYSIKNKKQSWNKDKDGVFMQIWNYKIYK